MIICIECDQLMPEVAYGVTITREVTFGKDQGKKEIIIPAGYYCEDCYKKMMMNLNWVYTGC